MATTRISTHFFTLAYGLSITVSLITALLWPQFVDLDEPHGWVYLSAVSGIASLFALVVFLVFIYKIWASIQDGKARTSAGKATGFLLIPFFHIYWLFQVIWGFARDYNKRMSGDGNEALKLPEGLYLAASILVATRWLYRTIATALRAATGTGHLLGPYSYFLTIPTCIFMIIVIYKSCNAVNALQEHRQ